MKYRRFILIPLVIITTWVILIALLGVFSLVVTPLETENSQIVQLIIGAFQLFLTSLVSLVLLFGWYKATIWIMNYYLKKPIIITNNTDN